MTFLGDEIKNIALQIYNVVNNI